MVSWGVRVGYFILVLRIHYMQIATARSLNSTSGSHGAHNLNGPSRNPMPHSVITIAGLTLQHISIAPSYLNCSPDAGYSVRSKG